MINKTVTINGVAYAIDDPNILKDCRTGEYIHTSQSLSRVYCDIIRLNSASTSDFQVGRSATYDNWEPVIGTTLQIGFGRESDFKINLYGYDLYNIYCTAEKRAEIIQRLNLVPGVNNPDIYYRKKELSVMDTPKPYRKFDNTYFKHTLENTLGRPVSKEDLKDPEVVALSKSIMKNNFAMGVDSPTHLEMEGIKKTFGVEIETCQGRIEPNEAESLNVKAVHDGSLRDENGNVLGGEYVTGILYGDAGLSQLYELCRVLQSKCKLNEKCGVHVHVGNIKWNKEDVVFSYILAEMIEAELFSMLPKSRRNNTYCRKLTPIALSQLSYLKESNSPTEYQMRIDDVYNSIFMEVSSGKDVQPGPQINKRRNHPLGPKCGYDKSAQRYCWLNYVTLMYNTKQIPDSYTLEFRPHSATMNYTKIKNWIKICIAFVSFVENHKTIIKNGYYKDKNGITYPLSLELIVKLSYPKNGDKLIDYIRNRKSTFVTQGEKVDYVEKEISIKKTTKEVLACA